LIVVFLDRDGVINENRDDYVKTIDEFSFLPGVLEGLAKLKSADITTIVVSNQAGVGRGIIDPAELERIDRSMVQTISEHGGEISAIYYCTHRKDEGCDCRKPNPGLLIRASRELGFDLKQSFFVGDAQSDIEAGYRAGCRTVLVLTGRTSLSEVNDWSVKPDYIAADLLTAVDWILSQCAGDRLR